MSIAETLAQEALDAARAAAARHGLAVEEALAELVIKALVGLFAGPGLTNARELVVDDQRTTPHDTEG